jgi:hypothetical protein
MSLYDEWMASGDGAPDECGDCGASMIRANARVCRICQRHSCENCAVLYGCWWKGSDFLCREHKASLGAPYCPRWFCRCHNENPESASFLRSFYFINKYALLPLSDRGNDPNQTYGELAEEEEALGQPKLRRLAAAGDSQAHLVLSFVKHVGLVKVY